MSPGCYLTVKSDLSAVKLTAGDSFKFKRYNILDNYIFSYLERLIGILKKMVDLFGVFRRLLGLTIFELARWNIFCPF